VLSANPLSLSEGNSGSVSRGLDVVLDRSSTARVTVAYSFAGGTATGGGVDYSGSAGTLSFAPGSTRQTIPFTIVGDTAVESDESFLITLSGPTIDAPGSPTPTFSTGGASLAVAVTISNDDTSSPTNTGLTLLGTASSESLSGGSGNDILTGLGGADSLNGGAGVDRFVYSAFSDSTAAAFDTISDFSPSLQGDRIGLGAPIALPGKLWNLGLLSATSLSAALSSAYTDANRKDIGSQALGEGEAMGFVWGPSLSSRALYLVVDNPSLASRDGNLVIRANAVTMGTVLGEVNVGSYFVSA
jgi:Ca2+-binding RTX toxin-like protein